MMHRVSTTAVVGMLALTGGCNWNESKTDNNSATIQPDIKPATSKAEQFTSVPFQEPRLKLKNTPIAKSSDSTALVGLTDGKQYVKQVQQGRSDPFARMFAVPPEIAAKPQAVPKPPALPTRLELPPPPSPPRSKAVPSPDLARGVAVQGIIETSKGLHAIVQLPNEATSRYVSVGQQLSNGQILIKKINLNSDSEPSVIIEQDGIEVAKAVGEEPVKLSDTKQPTATIPASEAVTSNSSEEVASQPPQSQAPAVKFGSQPKMYSKLLKVPSLPPSKKSLPAREYTKVAQTSSASLELPSPPNHVLASSPDSVAVRPEAILQKTQPSSTQQYTQQVSSRSLQVLAASNSSRAVELDERASQHKQLLSRLRKSSASSDSSPVVETNTRAAQYQQLMSRLSQPSELANSLSAAEINEQSAYYKELVSRLRKGR